MYNFQLKAYKANLLNEFLPTLTDLLEKSDSASLIRMPAHIKRFTLLKSPHVNKTAREQFELFTHKWVLFTDLPRKILERYLDKKKTLRQNPGVFLKFK